MRIDPHTHSTASDGRSTPAALMGEAARAGLDVIGLTDHDTVSGWDEATAQIPATGVALIPGMEMSTQCHGVSAHMLAYLFDPQNQNIQAHIQRVRGSRLARAQEMVANLARDVPISWEAVMAHVPAGATVGRPHIADALISAGVVATRSEAFAHLLAVSGPYYVPFRAPDAIEAVTWIREAGGGAVLAHPRARVRGRVIPQIAFAELAEAGLFGIEIDHRDNDPASLGELEHIAATLHLARFGSSDYHGVGKPNRLGEHLTAPAVIEALSNECQMEVRGL